MAKQINDFTNNASPDSTASVLIQDTSGTTERTPVSALTGGGLTDAQVKTAYENNADTNAFDDTEQTKLAAIPAAAAIPEAASTLGDNLLVRGDGAAKGIQNSGITVDDSDNLSGLGTLNTHTIPSGTDTLVGRDTSDTLTNKTLDFDSNTLQNVGNAPIARISGSTYSTIQHLQDTFHSSGTVAGGVISDAGSNTINVTAGNGYIRATDSKVAELLYFNWSAGVGISVPADTTRFVGVEYNAGTPQVVVRTTENWDHNTDFQLGIAVNEGGTIHFIQIPHIVGDHARAMIRRIREVPRFQRNNLLGGLALGEKGTRNIEVSTGEIWCQLGKTTVPALDTSASGTFDRYYDDGAGGHTLQSAATQWNNTQYDDGSGSLATLGANKYGVQWFYASLDGDIMCMYGTVEHNSLAEAEDEGAPSDVPDRIYHLTILLGRIIFKKSDSTTSTIESAFDVSFGGAVVTDHGSLSGLADDDHTQYLLADGTRALAGNLAGGGNDLTKMGTISMTEQAAANADVAGDGQFWVQTATPNLPMFTDDAGSDIQLADEAHTHVEFLEYIGQNLQTGTTYTLVLGDAGKMVEMNNASANTLTVPPNSSVAFPIDTRIDINQHGAGLTTVAQGAGVTIRGNLVSNGQYTGVSLWKRASDEWVLYGGTTA